MWTHSRRITTTGLRESKKHWRQQMTNREKLKEVFPYTIFIYRKEDDKTNAIMCTDEWLDSEYIEPQESEGKE